MVKGFVLVALGSLLVISATPICLETSAQTSAQTSEQKTRAANVVTDWNVTAVNVTQAAAITSQEQYRALAIAHAAIFDAVNAIVCRYTPYAISIKTPVGASTEAAAAAAGYGVLVRFYPAQQAILDTALKASLAKVPDGQSKTDGINVGKKVAEKLVALRSFDGWNAKVDYKPGSGAGVWQPTLPGFAPALTPHWSKVTPFTFKTVDQFQVPPPPALNSTAYIKDLNEVRSIGGKNSRIRTADQTATAVFWTVSTPIIWNAVARTAAKENGNSIIENARLFALLNLAGADAYIAGYSTKYKYNLWRPVTAIRAGSPSVTTDPNWEPLVITPPHPDYISGHCVSSGAPEQILEKFFGNKVNFSFTYPPNTGITRYYSSFSQLTQEVRDARVWGGIHTRTADIQGEKLGNKIGDYVFDNFLQPIKK